VPVDGFFGWKVITTRYYAVAMKGGAPFGIVDLWQNWRSPRANGSAPSPTRGVTDIHDRMLVIVASYVLAAHRGRSARVDAA
jgi:putative SOS response-associated peptidase YedK